MVEPLFFEVCGIFQGFAHFTQGTFLTLTFKSFKKVTANCKTLSRYHAKYFPIAPVFVRTAAFGIAAHASCIDSGWQICRVWSRSGASEPLLVTFEPSVSHLSILSESSQTLMVPGSTLKLAMT